jgi:hypothetical protein
MYEPDLHIDSLIIRARNFRYVIDHWHGQPIRRNYSHSRRMTAK